MIKLSGFHLNFTYETYVDPSIEDVFEEDDDKRRVERDGLRRDDGYGNHRRSRNGSSSIVKLKSRRQRGQQHLERLTCNTTLLDLQHFKRDLFSIVFVNTSKEMGFFLVFAKIPSESFDLKRFR